MNRIAVVAAAVTLVGCAPNPQPSTPQQALTPAQQAVIAKCGPPPTRSTGIGSPGSVLGALTGGSDREAEFQQRQAIYALCASGDLSYPAVLAEFIKAERQARALQQVPVSPR